MLPLAEPFPRLAPDLPGEVAFEDEDSNTANWLNHCIENGGISLEPGQDINFIFGSPPSCGFPMSTELMTVETIDEVAQKEVVERPAQPVTPVSVPASPASSDSSTYRSSSSMPRHKRPSHKRAELKRRDKIKNRLDDLKAEVPSIASKEKMSESAILSKAAEYAKHLKGDCERFSTEAGNLRQEIESLSTEIHAFQELLPAAGLTSETTEGPQTPMNQRLESYVTKRTKDNWKFYIFNFFMRHMFKSYEKEVVTDSLNSFESSLSKWITDRLSLSNLRPQSLEILKDVCKETEIMTHPESLPQQALASIGITKIGPEQPTISPTLPPLQMPTMTSRQPAVSHKTTSTVHQPAPTVPAPTVHCTSKGAYQLAKACSPKLKLITPNDPGQTTPRCRSPVAPHTTNGGPYPPARDHNRKLRSTSPKVSIAAAMKQEPFQLAVGSESVNPTRNHSLKTVTQSPSQQTLSRISVCPQPLAIAPQTTMSLPGSQLAMNTLANQQTPRSIVPAMTVSTTSHQPITSIFHHFSNITQLATSIGEASLNVTPLPVPAVSAKASPQPDTKVARLSISGISGANDCHLYDFDLTDIPLPDLPESSLSSPQPSFTTPFSCLTTIESFPLTVGSPVPSPAQPTSSILTFSHSSLESQFLTASLATPPISNALSTTSPSGS